MVIQMRKRGGVSSETLQRGGYEEKATSQNPERVIDQPWVRISVPILRRRDTGVRESVKKKLKSKTMVTEEED